MNENQYASLDPKQRKLVATAFLMSRPELRPEGSQMLFTKLEAYDASGRNVSSAIHDAQKSIQQLRQQMNQLVGSINTITEIIAEQLPDDKIQEWCMAYNLDEQLPKAAEAIKGKETPDIAGSTAKNLPPPVAPDQKKKG
jgi:hypothetical protein